jgi:hypothetical protein
MGKYYTAWEFRNWPQKDPSLSDDERARRQAFYDKADRARKARQWAKANPVSVRLQKKLARIGVPVELPKRSNSHHWRHRTAGAWAWSAKRTDGSGHIDVGSGHTMAQCLKMSDEELARILES